MREDQLQSLDKLLLNIEQLLSNIEMSKQQNAIFAALRSGTDVSQQIQKEVKLEDIDKLTEDTNEAKAYMDEIQEALAADSSEGVEQLEVELRALETTIYNEEIEKLLTTPEVQSHLFTSLIKDDVITDPNRASISISKKNQKNRKKRNPYLSLILG